MKVVYLVLSHRTPEQVLRLVRALCAGPAARVLVRHDQRRSWLDPADVEAAGAEPIDDGIEVEWAAWSHVDVILAGLRRAAQLDPDWVLVLSGQDYPLRPMGEIEADLAASEADAMLGAVREIETRRPAGDDEFFLRVAYRHYRRSRRLPHLPRLLRPLVYVRDLPPLVGIRRLRHPGLRLYSSADWLTLGRRGLSRVLAAGEDQALLRAFRRVAVPSESFFASVLINDPRLRVERDHRRFLAFAGPGVPHPETLTTTDLDTALGSGADFARKFDVTVDARPLDLLDQSNRASTPDRLDWL